MNRPVKNIINPNFFKISPDKNLEMAIEIFEQHSLKGIPVINNNNIIGLVSINSIIGNNKNRLIWDVMETDFLTINHDTTILETIDLMVNNCLDIIIVTDENEKFISALSLDDIYKKINLKKNKQDDNPNNINLDLFLKEIEETRDIALFGLASASEFRLQNKFLHIKVGVLSKLLANELQKFTKYYGKINEHFISSLFKSSQIHDLGKIGIPDIILFKKGRYIPSEFKIMKTHTTIGKDIICKAEAKSSIKSFLTMAKDIVYCHHEKYNGSGYPNGISGDEIPLSARIVATADAYDAITSHRPYDSARSHFEACKIFTNESGRHFDPDIVNAFLSVEAEFKKITDQ